MIYLIDLALIIHSLNQIFFLKTSLNSQLTFLTIGLLLVCTYTVTLAEYISYNKFELVK